MRKGIKGIGIVIAAMAILGVAAVPPASALEVGPLTVDIAVNTSDWSACGTVSDTLTGANYTAILTATGFESAVSRNGTILEEATAAGNPANPCTPGGFDSRYAGMEYTLVWTSGTGTTGAMTVACAEAYVPPIAAVDVEVARRAMAPVCTVS